MILTFIQGVIYTGCVNSNYSPGCKGLELVVPLSALITVWRTELVNE